MVNLPGKSENVSQKTKGHRQDNDPFLTYTDSSASDPPPSHLGGRWSYHPGQDPDD